MPAYMVDLETKCSAYGCKGRGIVEVYNDRNAPLGVYCRRHGKMKVRDWNCEQEKDRRKPLVENQPK